MEGMIIAALTWQGYDPGEMSSFYDETRLYMCSPNDMLRNYSVLPTAWLALCGTKWMQLD